MFRRFLILALLSLVSSLATFGQGIPYHDIAVVKTSGTFLMAAPGATIDVCTSTGAGIPCSPHASIFSDQALTHALPNPTVADSRGNFSFYAAPGDYVVTITGNGLTGYSNNIVLPCDPVSCVLTGPLQIQVASNQIVVGIPSNLTTLNFPASAGAVTLTFPLISDTVVARTTADTLTNKNINVANNSIVESTPTTGRYLRDNGTSFQPSAGAASGTGACGVSPHFVVEAVNDNAAPTCGQLAAADLSNGTTGSGAVVLTTTPTIATPVINGASTGTGVQGTDTKLLTAGTVSGTSVNLCTDANGGATTSGCSASVVQKIKKTSGCTPPSGSSFDACSDVLTWPVTWADTTYGYSCTGKLAGANGGNSGTNSALQLYVASYTTTSITVITQNLRSTAFNFDEISCTGIR